MTSDDIVAEWRERRDRGEAPEPEEFIRAHPELAEELRARFAVVQALEGRSAPEAPSRLGEYRILRELGRGGMGVVYEAEQTSMRRRVALKVLFPSVTSTPEAVKRFCREAWAAGRVKHTNIVAVHQLGQEKGTWFCAMELVEGRPLSRVIEELRRERTQLRESRLARRAQGAPTPSPIAAQTATGTRAYYLRVAEMFAEVAEALELAHDHGIVHRDVKPSNLLLDAEGRVKLVDFGLARLQNAGAAVTRTGDVVGTPLYMSPEQVTGRTDLDGRTDVYSLGATLYETLALRPPFRGETVAALAGLVIRSEPVPPRRIAREVPKDLETIVLKALEKEPARRYRTAGDMAHDLRAFVHGGVVRARRVGFLGRVVRRVRRNKVKSALAATALLAAGAAAFYGAGEARERERRAELEYDRLCLSADLALAHVTSWTEAGRGKAPTPMFAGDTNALEILDAAMRLRPSRPEAYFLRVMAPGRTREQRLKDIEAAGALGLSERSWRLVKADILTDAGRIADAEAEERLAARAGPSDGATLIAEGLIANRRGDRKRALELFSEALASVDAPVSVRCRALWWRSVLMEEGRDLDASIADLHALQVWTGERIVLTCRIASMRRRLGHEAEAETRFQEALVAAAAYGTEAAWLSLSWQCGASREYAWMERATTAGLLHYPRSARLHQGRGSSLNHTGRPEEAIVEFDRALDLDPTIWVAHANRAVALRGLGRFEAALAGFERALELAPEEAVLHSNRGGVLYNHFRRYADALAEFDRALELDPAYSTASGNRVQALLALGRPADAILETDRALRLDPDNAWVLRNRGAALLRTRGPKEALHDFARAAELEPNDALTHQYRGYALSKLGRQREALAAYDCAVALDANNAKLLASRAHVLLDLGRIQDAMPELDRALDLDPQIAEAHRDRGTALSVLERHAEALTEFDHAIDLNPNDPGVRYNRAVTLVLLKRFAEALAELDEVLNLDPSDVDARNARGVVLHDNFQRPAEALAEFDRVVELAPDNASAHIHRGHALRTLGRPGDALLAYERGAELNPSAEWLNYIARARATHPDPALRAAAKAVDLASRAVKLAPDSGSYWETLGIALCRAERWQEALDALDKSVELRNGGDANDWFFAAMAKWQLGKEDDARALYERAVAWADEHAPKDEDLRRFRDEAAKLLGPAEPRTQTE